MVDLGCQDTVWVGGNERDVLDVILLRNGHILATLGMEKGKCGYVGCTSSWCWALRVAPRVADGSVRVSGY